MAAFVVIAFGVDSQPEFPSCLSTDAGAKPVTVFSPGVPVTQGSIVIGVGEALPGELYGQWLTPANGWWIATGNIILPSSQPPYGASVDGLHFSLGPSVPPSG